MSSISVVKQAVNEVMKGMFMWCHPLYYSSTAILLVSRMRFCIVDISDPCSACVCFMLLIGSQTSLIDFIKVDNVRYASLYSR